MTQLKIKKSKSFNADKTSDAEQTINNSCKLLNECSDINNNTNKKENNTMVKVTVNVTGMMCGHCEAHVNKAIQEAFGVQDVVSSHYAGTTVFLLLSPLFLQLLCSFFHISPILSYINVNFSRIFILALKFYKFFSIMISIWVSQ